MKNLSQLQFLSDYLSTVIISKWNEEIAASIREIFSKIMTDYVEHFPTEKFRPFWTE